MPNVGVGISSSQVALSTNATLVIAARRGRAFCEIKNADSSINVYLGSTSGVTTATGHLLRPGEAFGFENYVGPVYAIAASGTPTVTSVDW